jgi:peptide/nickel transport system substrate-binding protein
MTIRYSPFQPAAAFACALLVALAAGCVDKSQPPARPGANHATAKVQHGGVVRLPLTIAVDDPEVQNLEFTDPRLFALARCLEVPLLRAQPDGKVEAGLADSSVTPDGGLSWSFKLRHLPGQEQDPGYLGKHLVKRFQEILRGPDGPLKAQLADQIKGAADYRDGKAIDSISGMSLDGDTLTVQLTRPNQVFPQWVTQPGLGVMENRTLPAAGWGPFGWVSTEGNELVLKANPDSLCGTPQVDELRFVCEPDKKQQLELFRAGKLDAANVDFSDVPAVRADAALKPALVEQSTAAMFLGLFNMTEFPWKNSRFQSKRGVRAAVNQGIDTNLLEQAYNSQFNPWRHFAAPYFKDDIPDALQQHATFANTAELDQAQWSLKEADNEQGSHMIPGMDLGYLRGAIDPDLVLDILEYWKDISVKMKPFPLTPDELARRVGNHTQHILLVRHCPAYPDVDAAFYPLLAGALSGNGGNYSGLDDPDLDKLLYAGQAATDPVVRRKVYQDLSQYLEDHADAVFIGNSTPTLLISPKLAGFTLSPFDYDASLPAQDFAALGLTATDKPAS